MYQSLSMEHKNMQTMFDSSPSTYQLNKNEVQWISLLLVVIESQNWEGLGCVISSNAIEFQQFARKTFSLPQLNGMTM